MKLFEIEITVTAVVVADDMDHAFEVANMEARSILSDDSLDDVNVTREIKRGDRLPYGWDGGCCAYGEDGGVRISEILDAQQPVVTPDTKTADMFTGAA